jgi:hypothetical protein
MLVQAITRMRTHGGVRSEGHVVNHCKLLSQTGPDRPVPELVSSLADQNRDRRWSLVLSNMSRTNGLHSSILTCNGSLPAQPHYAKMQLPSGNDTHHL